MPDSVFVFQQPSKVVGSSHESSSVATSFPSIWKGTWSHQSSANYTRVHINLTIALLPETSHTNVQSHLSSIQGQVLIGCVSKKLMPKRQVVVLSGGASVDSAKGCSICNIVYNNHMEVAWQLQFDGEMLTEKLVLWCYGRITIEELVHLIETVRGCMGNSTTNCNLCHFCKITNVPYSPSDTRHQTCFCYCPHRN